jgi:transcriptional regulator with XRE-family HTH domain
MSASVSSMKTDPDPVSGLGSRLKLLRERKGLSQRALASRLGISGAHVANIELEKTNYTRQVVIDWLAACDVTDADIALALDLLLVLGLADEHLKRSLAAQFAALVRDLTTERD